MLLALRLVTASRMPGLGDWSLLCLSTLPLLVAALAQSQVALAGGQGLAAGSTSLLINALLVREMGDGTASMVAWAATGPAIGAAIGVFNGYLIGLRRLPSTAVTLATGFVATGLTLQLVGFEGAIAPDRFRAILVGRLPGGVPTPLVATALMLGLAVLLDHWKPARRLRAAGRGGWNAAAAGHGRAILLAYALAGLGYGMSGVFLAAEIGGSEPSISAPTLLDIYAALALGGWVPRIRQGSALGAALGALAIGLLPFALTSLRLPSYAEPLMVAGLLLFGLRNAHADPDAMAPGHPPLLPTLPARVPAMIAAGLYAIVALLGFGGTILRLDPLLMIVTTAVAIALANVIATGAIDLSIPSIIGFAALMTGQLSRGSDGALAWVIPVVVCGGGLLGWMNGTVARRLGMPLLLVTLATAGALNAATLFVASALPLGTTPFAITNLLMASVNFPGIGFLALIAPLAMIVIAFRFSPAHLWRRRSTKPEGFRSLPSYPTACAASGFVAAGAGVLLPGYAGSASISAFDSLMATALVSVQLAGFCIGRRGGNPLLLAATVPMVIVADIMMVAFGISSPLRASVMGAILLASLVLRGDGASSSVIRARS